MTSVSTLGQSRIEAWMVAKLFGSSTQDKTGAASPTPPGLSDNDPGTTASMSSTTSQALLRLKAGGSDGSSADPSQSPESSLPLIGYRYYTTTQENALIKANNALTSDEVSEAMYGGGLSDTGQIGQRNTFASIIKDRQLDFDDVFQNIADDPSFSDAERQHASDVVKKDIALISSLKTAYAKHDVIFQKASDVQGFDFHETATMLGDPDGLSNVAHYTMSYNREFFDHNPDGKNHAMIQGAQGLQLYLTWD